MSRIIMNPVRPGGGIPSRCRSGGSSSRLRGEVAGAVNQGTISTAPVASGVPSVVISVISAIPTWYGPKP